MKYCLDPSLVWWNIKSWKAVTSASCVISLVFPVSCVISLVFPLTLKPTPPCQCRKTKPPSPYTYLPLLILHLTPSTNLILTLQLWLRTAKRTEQERRVKPLPPGTSVFADCPLVSRAALKSLSWSSEPHWQKSAKREVGLECVWNSSTTGQPSFIAKRHFLWSWGHYWQQFWKFLKV